MTVLLSKGRNLLALEMIDIQDSSFGVQIEAIITKMLGFMNDGTYTASKDLYRSEELKQLAKVIYDRIGIRVEYELDATIAGILPLYLNKHHVLINPFFRGEFTIKNQQKLIDEAAHKKGYVDTAKAKVGGIFSEYEHILYMNFMALNHFKFTASEITAIILHELGHAFYACEYSDRLESNNQVLANVAKELASGKEVKDKVYLYKEVKSINSEVTEADIDALVDGTKIVAGYKWFKIVVGSVKSQMENAKYDETAFEQLADNFAARFGYGRQLVIALDKLHITFGDPSKSKSTAFMINLLAVIWFAVLGIMTLVMLFTPLAPVSIYLALSMFVMLRVGDSHRDMTYDDLKSRYARVRNEFVEVLKTSTVSKDKLKTILEDVERLDKIIRDTENFKTVFVNIANVLFKDNKDAKKAIEEQKLLEELAFNDLYLASAKIKTQL